MSQAVRGALAILILLLVVVMGVAVFVLIKKQNLEQQNQLLQTQITDFQTKETGLIAKTQKLEKDAQELSGRISKKENEKQQIQQMFDELKNKSDALTNQIAQLTQERDDGQGRFETIRRERDDLMEKLRNQPEKIVYKERESVAQSTPEATMASAPGVTEPEGDQYWGQVLKDKASLQLEVEKIKSDLDKSILQIADLKKQNSDFQLQIKELADEKEEVERKIKYGEDLANSLSVEVARARSDQKFVNERAEKLKADNIALQSQIKQLTTIKLALERSISGLTDEKNGMQKKLAETESVIQGRIDEIWQIKQNLDQKISDLPAKPSSSEVELPPIIVNAGSNNEPTKTSKSVAVATGVEIKSQKQASIISINESNNFVIVDLGEADDSRLGQQLKVYRGKNEIATLEVIQVRKDISAADIKQKSTQLKVGDIVR